MEDKNQPITIAIVDDHSLFRQGLKSSLFKRKDIQVIIDVENGFQLLEILKQVQPDVILLDIQMPIMDGLTALPEIKKLYPSVKVIMLSMHNDLSVISRMMELGANAYLTKESGAEMIYDAINHVYQNNFYFNELTNKALLSRLSTHQKNEFPKIENVKLTENEILILKLMCDEKSTNEISGLTNLTPSAIEQIRDNLKIKTGTRSMAGLIMFAIKAGIVEELDYSDAEEDSYPLSKELMTKLFSLSTSILAYVNHDLAGQRNSIYYALELISTHIEKPILPAKILAILKYLIKKGFENITTIATITNAIKLHYYWRNTDNISDFNKLFLSRPFEIIEIVKQRYKGLKIKIQRESNKKLEIIYPPHILLAIISELVANSKNINTPSLIIEIRWSLKNGIFKCEIHDNGIGFKGIKNNSHTPLELLAIEKKSSEGMGLITISRTIFDSGGHLLFSKSDHLGGALVYFDFPIIDFRNDNTKSKRYNLQKKEMAKLFTLSTSILDYVNNDLTSQKNSLHSILCQIKEEFKELESQNTLQTEVNFTEIYSIISKALNGVQTINSITNFIKSHFHIRDQQSSFDLNRFFISRPIKIIEMVQTRYKDVNFNIQGIKDEQFEILYPPQLLLAIISELTENAKRSAKSKIELLINISTTGNVFKLEIHDNGPGFQNLNSRSFIPFESLPQTPKNTSNGMGLSIINKTILDSGGHLFFSKSKKLNGAMIYIEIPTAYHN